MLITVLLILGSSFVARSIAERNVSQRAYNSVLAFYLAEAGLDHGLNYLRSLPSPPGGTVTPTAQNLTTRGNYSVTISPDAENPGSYVKKYHVTSSGTVGDIVRQLVNTVMVDSFARFAYFTDWEQWNGNNIWFVTGDLIEGPVQTNGLFNIFGNPIFMGLVRSAYDYINYYHGGPPLDNPDFQGGLELGVEPISMPTTAVDLRNAAQAPGGIYLTGNTNLTFLPDGTINVTNANQGWSNENMPLPANGAFFVNSGYLTLGGVLDGVVSVGASGNIWIVDNVVYEDDPLINPASNDLLGVVAEGDVIVSTSAPYNLEIDASIMALGGSFIYQNWSSPPPEGLLTILGGLIQDERGPVGTFYSNGQKRSGYTKDYHYDTRLVNTFPPYLPTTGDYISLSWWEK